MLATFESLFSLDLEPGLSARAKRAGGAPRRVKRLLYTAVRVALAVIALPEMLLIQSREA